MAIIFSTSPADGATDQPRDVNIVVSFYNDSGVTRVDPIDAYVDGYDAYNGEYFFIPFDGYDSDLEYTNIDGYDGYTLTIDRSGLYDAGSTVNVTIVVPD